MRTDRRGMNMRGIAGSRRSLPLKTVPGKDTRPTTDRIKETLFNILMPYVPDCRFLDLFAGSGGIGIEALSRGASFACFCDSERQAVSVINDNLRFTKFTSSAAVIRSDSISLLNTPNKTDPYDVIFIDPPYNKGLEKEAVILLAKNSDWAAPDALIIIEASIDTDFSWTDEAGCEIIRIKEYKTNMHVFMKIKQSERT